MKPVEVLTGVWGCKVPKKSWGQNFVRLEWLQDIAAGSRDAARDFFKDGFIHKGRDAGCAEFVRQATTHDQGDTLLDGISAVLGSYPARIVCRIGLDVHGDVVHKLGLNELVQGCRMTAIGVEFDLIPHMLNILAYSSQIRVQGWLAPRDNDTFQKITASL